MFIIPEIPEELLEQIAKDIIEEKYKNELKNKTHADNCDGACSTCENDEERFNEFCASHDSCIGCECSDDCFRRFCDSHEDCSDCELFYDCFKNAYGHKYTIADEIDHVKFNGPAIVVFWKDGTKTVSVCSDYDDYDTEKGLAMCLLKKLLGDSSYNEVFRQFIPEEDDELSDEELEELYKYDSAVNDALNVVEELLQTKKLTDRQKDAIRLLIDEVD